MIQIRLPDHFILKDRVKELAFSHESIITLANSAIESS